MGAGGDKAVGDVDVKMFTCLFDVLEKFVGFDIVIVINDRSISAWHQEAHHAAVWVQVFDEGSVASRQLHVKKNPEDENAAPNNQSDLHVSHLWHLQPCATIGHNLRLSQLESRRAASIKAEDPVLLKRGCVLRMLEKTFILIAGLVLILGVSACTEAKESDASLEDGVVADVATDFLADLDLMGSDTVVEDALPRPNDVKNDGNGVDVGTDTSSVDAGVQDVQEDSFSPEDDTSSGFNPGPFKYSTTCFLPAEPEGQGGVKLVEAFTSLPPGAFNYPMGLRQEPGGLKRLFVYERFGTIKAFQNKADATQIETVFNVGGKLFTGGEGGLLGLAFHPNYESNGFLYLNYTIKTGGQVYTLVSRFTVEQASGLVTPGSELELLKIAQPFSNHNGGEIAFGSDGMLYVGMGDGGSGGDPYGHGQDLTTLLGAMLRVDVDTTSPGKNYGIPADNPFAQSGTGEAPEIWAWGLRNPWRFSFDLLTGLLWAGDVGQKAWEEIDVIEGGKNYGWNTMEGEVCYPPPGDQCNKSGLELPVFAYPNGGKGSVTGGYVYRGTKVPSLYGTYIFADYEHKTMWFLPIGALPPTEHAFQTPTKIAGFGQDTAGEVYAMGLLSAKIYRFAPVVTPPPVAAFPQTLTETGCFLNVDTLEPVEGVLPYGVNHPFWSSGAQKQRFFVLPQDGKIGFQPQTRWDFPNGTMFIKHFFLEGPEGPPIRLETRFLIQGENGVRGYVYRWNDEGTEASLLPSGDSRTLQLGETELVWEFPARHQCASCHTEQSGGVLGLETAQLNRLQDYAETTVNQIEAISAWKLFENDPLDTEPEPVFPAYPAPTDANATMDTRIRTYLHVNCSSCHDGTPASGMDLNLDFHASLSETKTCNVTPQKGDLTIDGALLLKPGAPDASLLYRRLVDPGTTRMPPIASPLVDWAASSLLYEWIESLEGCP
jgi:uncharacterized repeat protein (TIGR03806 family)